MADTLESQRQDLRAFIARTPVLANLNLLEIARPAVRFSARRGDVPVGHSRIGGRPDVPQDFVWPRWTLPVQGVSKYLPFLAGISSVPLAFIAQLDLSQLPRISDLLPDSGWLYFFYDLSRQPWGFDPADRGAFRVLYSQADRATLKRADPPADADSNHTAKCCALDASAVLSVPTDMDAVEYGTPVDEAYQKLLESLGQGWSASHQLLGYPGLIQNAMELECQLVSSGIYCGDSASYASPQAQALKSGAADWRLLLQIDSDDKGPGWMWGDLGRIYFWIREEDLRACRFENVWLILQCF